MYFGQIKLLFKDKQRISPFMKKEKCFQNISLRIPGFEFDNNILENNLNPMANMQTFKFIFTASIGILNIKANVSSPTFVTWKRSQESVSSQVVEMVSGKGDFGNEQIQLPVNMYYDKNTECFQEKKSAFSFTMKTPKGEKTAGVVYVDLSKMLNNKLQETNQQYTLEKCPVNGSTVGIKITSECVGERSGDTQSQASLSILGGAPSTLSIQSVDKSEKKKELKKEQNTDSRKKQNQQLQSLRRKVQQLSSQNSKLSSQVENMKIALKSDGGKEELIKAKSIQNRLENEVNTLKEEKITHEKELQSLRQKLEDVYHNLQSSLQHVI